MIRVKDHALDAILTSGDGGRGASCGTTCATSPPVAYAVPVSIAFVRADAFAALTRPVQAAVEAAAAETEARQFERLVGRTAENAARMRANAVAIDPPTPALVVALHAAARGPVARWEARVDPEAASIVDRTMAGR